jgi:putative SOS response-associated peptidase YedK
MAAGCATSAILGGIQQAEGAASMCARYMTPEEAAVERQFDVTGPKGVAWLRQVFNTAPTMTVPVIRWHEGRRELLGMRWGLIPDFARGHPGPYSTVNARVETIRTSAAYRGAWKRGQRCLIPANGFYEWQRVADDKQPWFIGCADQPVFAFAGLWDSSTPENGETILSCAIITLPASPMMADIHNARQREPAILNREHWQCWLNGSAEEAFACLQQYPDELRSAWPVSKRVNSPRNNDAALATRVQSAPTLF